MKIYKVVIEIGQKRWVRSVRAISMEDAVRQVDIIAKVLETKEKAPSNRSITSEWTVN